MPYKLLAVDMDGTLLDSDRNISKKNMKALLEASEQGVLVVVATGRALKGVTKYRELLKLNAPVITYNGSMIVHPATDEILFEQELVAEDARKIIRLGLECETTMCIWSDNQLYGNVLNDKIHDYKTYSGVEPVLIEDYDMLYKQGITKILWYDAPAKLKELELKFNEESFFKETVCCRSMPFFLEFFNSKASKGQALKKLGELYQIPLSEMIAIGDADNDISMLEFAGISVAMGNADERLKKMVDYVTSSNDENGVAEVIQRYIL